MNRITATMLDATWKRAVAAVLMSGAIVLAVSTFAQSSYIQTQKVQIESAERAHCAQWEYQSQDGETRVSCARWAR